MYVVGIATWSFWSSCICTFVCKYQLVLWEDITGSIRWTSHKLPSTLPCVLIKFYSAFGWSHRVHKTVKAHRTLEIYYVGLEIWVRARHLCTTLYRSLAQLGLKVQS